MFFDKPEEIGEIARKNGASVFVMPKNIKVEIKNKQCKGKSLKL